MARDVSERRTALPADAYERNLICAAGLTRRELDTLTLSAQGLMTKEIAASLFVAPTTVKAHLSHIRAKLGAATTTAAVARAYERGILPTRNGR